MEFRTFLEAASIKDLPNVLQWARHFFSLGMNTTELFVYGDQLEEMGNQKAAELFHGIGGRWRDPKLKKGNWGGRLVSLFYDVMGHISSQSDLFQWQAQDSQMRHSWFFTPWGERESQMSRHIVHPTRLSYRLSLNDGKWYVYTNEGQDRVGLVSTRHQATPESERWFPQRRITIKDYKLVPVEQVPDELVLTAFYKILEKQVRGGH